MDRDPAVATGGRTVTDNDRTQPLNIENGDFDTADLVLAAETAPAPMPPEPPATATESSPASALRPRTRWAGIVWGLAFAVLAGCGIWLGSGEGRVDDLVAWVRTLSATTAIGYGVLAIGALLLVTGVVGLLRRAQRAVAARRG